jgi:Tol biopolymer transport system component
MLLTLLFTAHAAPIAVAPDYDANCQAPRWSRDGSKLSYEVNYHDRKTVEQYIWSPGAEPRKVLPTSRGLSGISIGFESAGGDMVVHELSWAPSSMDTFVYAASGADRDYDLYLDGGSPLHPGPGTDGGANWSPDGRWIAFTSARTGQGDLYLLDVEALEKDPKRLTADPTASELYAAWSPDSTALVFVGHTRTGDNIYLLDDLKYPAPVPLTTWQGTQTHPSFSPNGKQIAFYSNHDNRDHYDLYVLSLGGGAPFKVATDVVMNADGPVWMPDGERLIYVKNDDANFDPIYIGPVDSPRAARPVNTGTIGNSDHALVVGPDGFSYLAVAAQGTDGNERDRDFKRVYVIRVD